MRTTRNMARMEALPKNLPFGPAMEHFQNAPRPTDPVRRRLVEFYHPVLSRKDWQGRSFDEIISLYDEDLDKNYNFMNWLFPCTERTDIPHQLNEYAVPILDENTFLLMRQDEGIGQNLKLAVMRMLIFFGYRTTWHTVGAIEVPTMAEIPGRTEKFKYWATQGSQGYMHLARIMRSVRLMGYANIAGVILRALRYSILQWQLFDGWPQDTVDTIIATWERAVYAKLEVALDRKVYAEWLDRYNYP
ncbi:hypothetical protein F5Y11DRAFT_324101 [Daldinia sp. FL1419]|nr:hypothetical protein F5Y11DRAFT_324101 [Daldinia sp. FL1419]